MSEIDLELQKQTKDVSITEMMQEAEDMQRAFTPKEDRTGENIIGETDDGK